MKNVKSKKFRYRAFISYSRKDVKHARRLQRALEAYKIPSRLNKNLHASRKLGRFFCDDDELGGTSDLGAAIRGSLEDTENLIVICSPHSAQSEWVKNEIIHFKTTDRADCIFAVIVDGTPMSDDTETECFSPALQFKVSPDGKLTNELQEALGIDVRIQSYRKILARLIAGMLDLPFDDLWQKNQRTYQNKILKWSIGVSFALLLLGALGIWQARQLWIGSSISLAKTAKQENDARRFDTGLLASLAASPENTGITTPSTPEARAQLERSAYNNRLVADWFYGEVEVFCVSFSPDGKVLLTGETFGRVTLRKVVDGKIIHTLQKDSSMVITAAYSPSGNLIATGNNKGIVRVWDPRSGDLRKSFSENTSRVNHVSFSNNEKSLLTAGFDGYIRLWETETFEKFFEFKAHEHFVEDASFTQDDSKIWTVSGSDNLIRLWDTKSGLMLKQFYTKEDEHAISLSSDELTILTAESFGNVARLRDAETGEILNTYAGPEDGLINVVISPDGKTIAGASKDGKTWIWDFENGEVIDQLEGHIFRALDVAFSPNSTLLASSGAGGFVRLWDCLLPKHSLDIKGLKEENIYEETIFKSNGLLYVVSQDFSTNDIQIWKTNSGALTATLSGHEDGITHVIANSSGTLLLSSSYDGTARVWDLKTKKQVQQFAFPFISEDDKGVGHSIFTKTDDKVLSAGRDGTVRTWRIDTGEEIEIIQIEDQVAKVSLSPDEEKIITYCSNKPTVELWKKKTGELLRQFYLPPDGLGYEKVRDITFSPDGRYIAAASSDRLAVLWEVKTGVEIHRFTGHPLAVRRVLFSPNGRNLVTIGDEDGSLRFWDTETGENIFLIANHHASHDVILFENSGRELISLNDNNILTFWDISLSSMLDDELLIYARRTWPEGLIPQGRSQLPEHEARRLFDNQVN